MVESHLASFLRRWPIILFPVFQRPATIGIDVVDMLRVVALVVVIVVHWS
jgi:hypothetical protein